MHAYKVNHIPTSFAEQGLQRKILKSPINLFLAAAKKLVDVNNYLSRNSCCSRSLTFTFLSDSKAVGVGAKVGPAPMTIS